MDEREAQRAAFEKWAVPRVTLAPVRRGEGYAHIGLNWAWQSWQAALDSQAARIDKLEVLLRKMVDVFDEDGIDYTPRHKMPSMIGEADYLVNGAGRALAAGEKP